MATTTNYGWTTPDDTALVKDGASAIRTLGTSVDTTTKNLNPQTTLGDLAYRSSTSNVNTRLGIGTSGQVLTVSGGVPTWAAAPAGYNPNYTLLNSGGTALSGSSTQISGISSKTDLYILVDAMSASTTAGFFVLTLNNDTGNNYTFSGLRFQSNNNPKGAYQLNGANTYLVVDQQSATRTYSTAIRITGCNSSGVKPIHVSSSQLTSVDDTEAYLTLGHYSGSSTISSIEIKLTSGSFDAGTVYVYGA